MSSGNIGLYYDLENLLKDVEKIKPGTKTADNREVVFAFVGAVCKKASHGQCDLHSVPG